MDPQDVMLPEPEPEPEPQTSLYMREVRHGNRMVIRHMGLDRSLKWKHSNGWRHIGWRMWKGTMRLRTRNGSTIIMID